ncbi:hypothetical protein DXG01_006036 [Tephrocybe rancida]|nr:hypothetical protein DXG01_006036 [Tephrocybe rancida]
MRPRSLPQLMVYYQDVRRSPRKMERKAVYVLNLTVPSEQLDNCLEPAKAHIQFRHGFLTPGRTSRPGSNRGSPSPKKRRKVLSDDDSNWVKAYNAGEPPSRAEDERDRRPVVHLSTTVNPADDVKDVIWTDPMTSETFIVDSRTGHSRPHSASKFTDGDLVKGTRRTVSVRCCANTVSGVVGQISPPEWLTKALQANKSYEVGENLVMKCQASSKFQEEDATRPPRSSAHHVSFQEFRSELRGPKAERRQHRFRKEDLRRAKIISQVDAKFIACLLEEYSDGDGGNEDPTLPSSDGQVLVLIDQHAADERVRVERFLKDLCSGFLRNRNSSGDDTEHGIPLKEFSPPVPLLLTQHESRRLKESFKVREAFRHWGFHFNFRDTLHLDDSPTNEEHSESGYTQIAVQSVPEIVSDKVVYFQCKISSTVADHLQLLLGDELRDLVKGFLAQPEIEMPPISGKVSSDEGEDRGEFPWLKALRWCPRELLDLIHSKACRGAIMFNDSLSIPQLCTWTALNGAFDQSGKLFCGDEQRTVEMVKAGGLKALTTIPLYPQPGPGIPLV